MNKLQWRLFAHALSICAEILAETDFNPSGKQRLTILNLIRSNMRELYGSGLSKPD